MKTIGRILAILLAITAVAGATYALGQTSWFAEQFAGRGGDRDRIQLQDGDGSAEFAPSDFEGGRPERQGFGREREGGPGFEGRGREGSAGVNTFALSEFGRILLPMALVVTAVVLMTKLSDYWRKRRKTAVAANEPLTRS